MKQNAQSFVVRIRACANRDEAARVYVDAPSAFWPDLEREIVNRWSRRALVYVKGRAWALALEHASREQSK